MKKGPTRMRHLVLVLLLILLTACGKKGPLVYPEMLVPSAPSAIEARQIGAAVRVGFDIPSRDLAGRQLSQLSEIKVYKRDEPGDLEQTCNSCTADFVMFRAISLDSQQQPVQRYGNRLVYLDEKVEFDHSYTYRLAALTKDGQEGSLSAPVRVRMLPVSVAPILKATSYPTEIVLEIMDQAAKGGELLGYSIYRSVKGEHYPYIPLTNAPVRNSRYVDNVLDRDRTYVYRVRRAVISDTGVVSEGVVSNEAEGRLKNDE